MKRTIITLLIVLMAISAFAAQRSAKKAMLFSALLPGAGEIYVQDYTKGSIFLSVEAAIIFSYFRLQKERTWAIDSYKEFAFVKADVAKDNEDWYYQLIQDWESSERYNQSIYRDARNYYLIYKNDPQGYQDYLEKYLIPEENQWDWETNTNWQKFRSMRHDKQNFEIYQNFAIAAMILNRLVSVVDVTTNMKHHKRLLSGLSVEPDFAKNGVQIRYEYRF